MKYVVTLERVGRHHNVPPLEVEVPEDHGDPAGVVAEAVWRAARSRLGSRDYSVVVDIDEGWVSIEANRFGSGTVVAQP